MQILAHRGYWNEEIASNSPQALQRALEAGYGFESDLRDYCGELVIAHDIATANSQKASEVFDWLAQKQDQFCFAINIKADGLKHLLSEALKSRGLNHYFVFDMSVPQMLEYRNMGLKFYTRQSEIEQTPILYADAAGVWIDAFYDEAWITKELLAEHMKQNKRICLVSPDLHKRQYKAFWAKLKGFDLDFSQVMLCTDYPHQAEEFFNKGD